ncbi:nephrin-like protein [Dinothrombium tinctorium]|uniref:Nephrin-like protein n=1 Tax=Dinothrombium tinctorium TaxID=1965070 RepID=A0A443RA76_9ACAR|nr:nephrin-like protein [Dinothrombium tinctorium]
MTGFQSSIPGYPRYAMIIDAEKGLYHLRIHNTQLDDEGEYQCQVGPAANQQPIRASSRLSVIVPVKSLTISGSKTSESSYYSTPKKPNLYAAEVKEGEKLVLICYASASKPPPRVKWFRKNTELLPEASRTYYNKTIVNNKYVLFTTESSIILYPKTDEQYSCEVQHPGLVKPLRATAFVNILTVPDRPVIDGFKEGDAVTVSESLTLTCTSKRGFPPPKVVWYRNGVEVDRSFIITNRNEVVNSHMFVVTVDDNQAVYKCSASNSLTPRPLEAAIRLNVLFLPTKVTISGPSEAKLLQTIAIKCTTRPSNPPPRISWFVDGNASSSGTIETKSDGGNAWIVISTLTLTITSKDPSVKTFTCQAESSALRDTVFATHKVTVIYPPNIPTLLGHNEGSPIPVGTLKKFKCTTLGGNPPPTLKWFREDREISGITSVTGSGVSSELVIRPEPEDNGVTYKCQASSAALTQPYEVSFTLIVHYPPEKATITIEPSVVKANETVKVECITSESNPASVIEWRKNGKNVINAHEEIRGKKKNENGLKNGEITRSWFTFTASAEDDGSVITCLARNPLIESSLTRDDLVLTVFFKPSFKDIETRLLLIEGENKVVNLSLKANPKVQRFRWRRVTGKAANGFEEQTEVLPSHSMRTNGSLLYIWSISRNDSGRYVVTASNEFGHSKTYLTIDVHYSASIVEPINVITSSAKRELLPQEGDPYIELHCRIDSNPSAKVQWRKEDKEQNIDWFRAKLREEKFPQRQTSILTVLNISRSDSGTYTCSAFNGIGTSAVVERVHLHVQYKPQIVNDALKVASEVDADFAKIGCSAKGYPNVLFVWSIDGKERRNGSKYKIINLDKHISDGGRFDLFQSELIISKVGESDFGKYRCRAYNHLGSDETDVELVRRSVPDSPYALRLVNISHDWVQLEWQPGFDGGLEQSFRIRYRRVTREEKAEENHFEYHYASPASNQAVIRGLQPDTEYHFTVTGRNKLGESLMSREFLKVKTQPLPSGSSRSNSVYEEHRLGQSVTENTPFLIGCIVVVLLLFASSSAFIIVYCHRRKHNEPTGNGKGAVADTVSDQSPFLISSNTALQSMCNCEPTLPCVVLPEMREDDGHQFESTKCLYFEVRSMFLSDYKDCAAKLMPLIATLPSQPDILMNQIKDDSINHSICCEEQFKVVDGSDSSECHQQEHNDLAMLCRTPRVSIVGPEYVATSTTASHAGHSPLSTVPEEAEAEEVV